jgi:S-DNA-T family DNA segregation ATPase FtsK/SpoIIIE
VNPHVSVSQLRLASTSWDAFRKSLAGGKVPPWTSGSGKGQIPGSFFHDRIAAPFMKAMHAGKLPRLAERLVADHGDPSRTGAAIYDTLRDHCLDPAFRESASALKADQILAIAAAAEQLARALAKTFGAFPRPRAAADVGVWVLPPEKLYETSLELPGGPPLSIAGRFDAALFDPATARARVIDFKCKDTGSVATDLLQIALYGWLIHRSTGLDVDGMLLFLGPEGTSIEYPASQLAGVACSRETMAFLARARDEVVAFQATRAGSGRGEKAAAPPGSHDLPPAAGGAPSGTAASDEQVQARMERLLDTLARLKCHVSGLEPIVGPRVIRCRVVPDLARTTVNKLIAQAKNLQVALELPVPPVIQAADGYVSVDIPRRAAPPLLLADVLRAGAASRPRSVVAFPVGIGIDGVVFWADMASPTMTSILVGGTAGSGKSEFLKSAVVAMCQAATPEELKFTLVDPKLVTFTELKGLPHLDGPILFDPRAALDRMTQLVDEMERRYPVLAGAGVSDIEQYNAGGRRMAHHVVLIDEYADLMMDREMRAALEAAVQKLGQKGRAAGLHLVLATQRPDAKVVSPLVKANLQLKVALKVSTRKNSEVILDEGGAQNLLGRGDLFVGGPVPVRRLQSPLTTRADIDRLLASGAGGS